LTAVLAFGLAVGGPATADSQEPEPQAVSHSPAEVRQWVRDLDSDSFLQREIATKKLIDAGVVSIEPLVAALSENNLEVTTRAIYVLRELALSNDPESEQAARKILEETARPRGTSAARRARETLARLDRIRRERSLDELKELGAVITEQKAFSTLGERADCAIEIGASWRGQADDLHRLRHVKGIGNLVLEGERVTDAWLEHIPRDDAPKALTIKRASVTDVGIEHLAGIEGMQWLSLMYVPITDQSAQHLSKINGVTTVRLYGSRMTRAGADRLRATMVGTEIDFRSGAFLGIGCQAGETGCVVYTVRPDTAADEAGLQIKDVIYEYEGKPVTDFEQLTAMIAENRAGDTVTVKILRQGQKLEKRITLGQWE
jgi:hypothetical protein